MAEGWGASEASLSGCRLLISVVLLTFALVTGSAYAQGEHVCNPLPRPESRDEQERQQRAAGEERWQRLEDYVARLPSEPDRELLMPVQGVRVRQIADTWGAPRPGGRFHEGQDIFAPRLTPVYAAVDGYVWRVGYGQLGGNYLFVVGAGGMRYYYAHLHAYAAGLQEGDYVTRDTLIGYVGNTGNAFATPPHLHFGIYFGSWRTCNSTVINPLPLLVDR